MKCILMQQFLIEYRGHVKSKCETLIILNFGTELEKSTKLFQVKFLKLKASFSSLTRFSISVPWK